MFCFCRGQTHAVSASVNQLCSFAFCVSPQKFGTLQFWSIYECFWLVSHYKLIKLMINLLFTKSYLHVSLVLHLPDVMSVAVSDADARLACSVSMSHLLPRLLTDPLLHEYRAAITSSWIHRGAIESRNVGRERSQTQGTAVPAVLTRAFCIDKVAYLKRRTFDHSLVYAKVQASPAHVRPAADTFTY